MAVPVPVAVPFFPEVAQIRSARPVHASTASALFDAANHLAGWRFRPVFTAFLEGDVGVVAGVGYDEAIASWEARIRFYSSPLARLLYLRIEYIVDDVGSGNPRIEALLEDTAGTIVEIGCQWRTADGTLPAGVVNRGASHGLQQVVSTGTVPDMAPIVALTRPRPLNLTPATDTVLRLTGYVCRAYAVSAWELASETIG